MNKTITKFLVGLGIAVLMLRVQAAPARGEMAEESAATEESDDRWYVSVKGHIHPGSRMNHETREMAMDIWWDKRGGKGKVELVPAWKASGDDSTYVDIHSGSIWPASKYKDYGENMWYLQIDAPYKVVEPLFLHFYFEPNFVYEGDLNQDGIPDFGILLTRYSICSSYALLTIKDGHWTLLRKPFLVTHNLRASGKQLARRGLRKGEILLTKSVYRDDLCSCMESVIVDTVVKEQFLETGDFL